LQMLVNRSMLVILREAKDLCIVLGCPILVSRFLRDRVGILTFSDSAV